MITEMRLVMYTFMSTPLGYYYEPSNYFIEYHVFNTGGSFTFYVFIAGTWIIFMYLLSNI